MDRLKSTNLSQFCPVCDADTMHTSDVSLSSFSSIFIIRLATFSYCEGQPTRESRKVDFLLKDNRLTDCIFYVDLRLLQNRFIEENPLLSDRLFIPSCPLQTILCVKSLLTTYLI